MEKFSKILAQTPEKALRCLPRVTLYNVKELPQEKQRVRFAGLNRKKRGLAHRGFSQFQSWRPIGHMEKKYPFYIRAPIEQYNSDHLQRRPLQRISLLELQRLIDMNRIDPLQPIDITTICNTKLFSLDPQFLRHYGFELTEEGIDDFDTAVDIEVQHASEAAIAAIERAGGIVTTRFYDLYSVYAKRNPVEFFQSGQPIPRCKYPPQDAIDYYTSPNSRGYLCSGADLLEARFVLSQKYGYPLVEMHADVLTNHRKNKYQIFEGLEPGWVVNLKDEEVLAPVNTYLTDFYSRQPTTGDAASAPD